MLRIGVVMTFVACAMPYGRGEVEPDVWCFTVGGTEVCGSALTERSDGHAFRVLGDVRISGVDFGWEGARLDVEIEVERDDRGAWSLHRFEGLVPARVTCVVDEAHGDHCHMGVAHDRACELRVAHADRGWVDRFDDDGVELRVAASTTDSVPDCCVSTCTLIDRPPRTQPALPVAVVGALHGSWGPALGELDQ